MQQKWPKKDLQISGNPGLGRSPLGYTIPVGVRSIGPVDSGSYFTLLPGLPMVTHVFVTWAFDDKDALIEVLVHKEIDAP